MTEHILISLHKIIHQASLWEIAGVTAIGFGLMYATLAGLTWYLTQYILPKLGIGKQIDTRPLKRNQIRSEIGYSTLSIIIFSLYGTLTVWCERNDLITINWQPSFLETLVNLAIISVWNESHFYLCHRLLHIPILFRNIHRIHHRSIVPTPFSTYSFHPLEATLLSSVMICLLVFWPLDILSILFFPLISLLINTVGHMNYAIFTQHSQNHLIAGCQRHTAHHSNNKGNFGFYLPWIDRLLKTQQVDKSKALDETTDFYHHENHRHHHNRD